MKSSKHILVGIILVMIAVFASSVFAQVTLTQPSTKPPLLQKTDPKLRELQAAEQRKRVSRQLALKAEITKLVQKDLEIKKTKKVEICTSPKIFYVSSREVYPGDPVYIRGCGFGISKGMVAISPLNKQLEIETWVDGGIVGKIPSDITGFADPKTITLKVITIQGKASDPSASLTLKPNIQLRELMLTQPTFSDVCFHLYYKVPNDYSCFVEHVNNQTSQQCQGMDIIFQGCQLHSNWVFHYFDWSVHCREGDYEKNKMQPISCNQIGSQANPVQNMNLLIGKSTIPRIEINWVVGPVRPSCTSCSNQLIYNYLMVISGPEGTSYQ